MIAPVVRIRPVRIGLIAVALAALAPGVTFAHDARPLGVHLEETAPQRWRLTVWTPPGLPTPAVVVDGCKGERGTLSCDDGPRAVTLRYRGAAPSVSTLVQVERVSGERWSTVVGPDVASVAIPRTPETGAVLEAYLGLGVRHVLEGVDHLLFVLLLVFVAGTARRTLLTVSGFTLAHSITLALATLDVVRVSVRAVEASIALSIVLLALELARGRSDSLAFRYPIAVAGSFGLLHGFGFAAALADVGLPSTELPAALVAFNGGVEVGQVAFVAVVFGALRLLERIPSRDSGRDELARATAPRLAAYGAGVVGMYWTIERVMTFWT